MILAKRFSRPRAVQFVVGAMFAAIAVAAAVHIAAGSSSEKPGDLGLLAVELPARLPESFDPERSGALVSYVLTGGPADKAGVLEGDIVLSFDNQAITGAADLLGRIRRLGAGRLASMVVWRNGREINTGLMTLAERGEFPGEIVGGSPTAPRPGRGQDSRQDVRIRELESEVRGMDRDLTDLRRRVERLEAEQRSMVGR